MEPSIETASPSRITLPATFMVLALALMSSAPQPTTEGLPIWRPTTAACDVMPPVAVRMPWATDMPWMSSGTVSMRTSRTFLPFCAHATASSAVKTTAPVAAPGEAGRPFAATATVLARLRVEDRVQELVERLRLDLEQRFLLRDEALLAHVDRDLHGGQTRPLAVAGLEHVQGVLLDGELEVLHVLVVPLEAAS